LTLHLARAIHAANPFPPPLPLIKKSKRAHRPSGESSGELPLATISEETEKSNSERDDAQNAYDAYLPSRRAIVQTLDISESNSRHAEDVVRNFRRGMYYHNVDFHVGTISEYISTRLSESTEPFLSHAILDLPDTYSFMELMAKAIKPNGSVLEFCPNVTQIAKTIEMVKEQKLPWALEKVLEIGMGAGVGGRPWSVRAVKPRALLRAEAEARQAQAEQTDTEESEDSEAAESAEEVTSSEVDSGWEMVCRPSVGMMIGGGGFVGQWRRTSRE
jgi:tRNA (adenine57-N1/adenine58-N1)-methyltransferase